MKRTPRKTYVKNGNRWGVAILGYALLPFGALAVPTQSLSAEFVRPCDECTYEVVEVSVEQVASETAVLDSSEASYSTEETISITMLADKPVEKNNKSEVEAFITEVFGKDAEKAIEVARCESGLRKEVVSKPNRNGTRDYHTFQINDVHTKRFGDGFKNDWKENVRVAKKIFDEQGFRPWVCAKAIGEKSYLYN